MSDNKVPLTAKDVAELYASAVKNGTLIAWARLALEWMGHAEAEIVRLCADAPPAADAVSVEVIDGRVWIIRGVQRWMLAYDDAEHAEWYAGTLRAALAARDAK